MRQTTLKKPADVQRKFFLIDAEGKTLGRLATQVANILRGKDKVDYTPNIDCGDHVIIINCEKVKLTGNKLETKKYYNHSQYAGGLRTRTAEVMINNYPREMFERAVKGMLQHNSLGRKQFKKLHVFAGAEHNLSAQQPVVLEVK